MYGSRRKALLVSAALVGSALLMTACQDTDSDSDAARGSSPAAAAGRTASPSDAPETNGDQGGAKTSAGTGSAGQGKTSGNGAASGTGSGANGKTAKCRTDDLKITAMDSTITGDSDGTVAVELKNSGGHACAMSGYAGVDLKTNAGSLSAERTGEKGPSLTLRSGQQVTFGINYPLNESGGSGVRVTGLLVTPPDETKTVTLSWPGGTLPVTEGGGSSVKVGPLGSAGQGG